MILPRRFPAGLGLPVLLAAVALLASACAPDPERREREFMPDMYRNPAVKAQDEFDYFRTGSAMLVPPEGTIPRGFEPYPFGIAERDKAAGLENPLPVSRRMLETGRKYYNIHCMICHGVTGSGDGQTTLVHQEAGMPVPPPLYSQSIREEWTDGELFHVISMGQGQMPGYRDRISREHRWAIVHYTRALGLAADPTEEDLEAVERLGWDAPEMDRPERPERPRDLQSIYIIE